MEKQLDVPPPESLRHLSRVELRDALWKSYGGPALTVPWPGPVSDLYYGWMGLGRDMNGTTLHSERESWLRSNGWTDPGEWEVGMYLFQVLEAELAEVREILHPTPTAGK